MKHFRIVQIGGALFGIGLTVGFMLAYWMSEDNTCLQQQAGYQVALASQTKLLTTQIDLLAKEKARAGLLQAAHIALQDELATTLAAKVGKIDDVWAMKMPVLWDGGTINAKIRWKSLATSEPVSKLEQENAIVTIHTRDEKEIERLAARLAPVEAKVKEVAKDNHEFIPAALRDYWSKVKANPSVAEQLVGKVMMRGK